MFSLFIMFVDPLYYQWLQAVTTLETKQKKWQVYGIHFGGQERHVLSCCSFVQPGE